MWMPKSESRNAARAFQDGHSKRLLSACIHARARFLFCFGVCCPRVSCAVDTMKRASWCFWHCRASLAVREPLFSEFSLSSLFDVPHDPPSSRESIAKNAGGHCLLCERLSAVHVYAVGHDSSVVPARRLSPWLRRMDLQGRYKQPEKYRAVVLRYAQQY